MNHPDTTFPKCRATFPTEPVATSCHKLRGHDGDHESLSSLGTMLWHWPNLKVA